MSTFRLRRSYRLLFFWNIIDWRLLLINNLRLWCNLRQLVVNYRGILMIMNVSWVVVNYRWILVNIYVRRLIIYHWLLIMDDWRFLVDIYYIRLWSLLCWCLYNDRLRLLRLLLRHRDINLLWLLFNK
jgi:hypothetical protein